MNEHRDSKIQILQGKWSEYAFYRPVTSNARILLTVQSKPQEYPPSPDKCSKVPLDSRYL